ncbi:MAG: hypothetical protein NTY72_14755 [Bacteroidetes bacterium]|nr:hypothetical protein [Bacteroidota bacterium]
MNKIITSTKELLNFSKNVFGILLKEITNTNLKYVLIVPLLSATYYLLTMPVSYDEAWTYLYFSSRPLLTSITTYPAPNNHILHSIITHFAIHIPVGNILFRLRISNLLVSIFTWVLIYAFVSKFFSKISGLIVVGISSMLYMSVYYSYMSRGYALETLFFTLSLFSIFKIIDESDNGMYWKCFCISNILGFYTIPTYLYAFILLNIIVLLANTKGFKNFIKYSFFTITTVFILYLPIILNQGINTLINNRYTKPVSRFFVINNLKDFAINTITEITGLELCFLLPFFLLVLVALIKKRLKISFILFIVFLFGPFIILIAHSVIPHTRTFNYYSLIILFVPISVFNSYIKNRKEIYIVPIVIVFQVLLLLNFSNKIKYYEGGNIAIHEINKTILMYGKTYYTNSDLFYHDFKFEALTNKIVSKEICFPYSGINVSSDTISNFDYIILDRKYDITKIKKPIYTDNFLNIYTNK